VVVTDGVRLDIALGSVRRGFAVVVTEGRPDRATEVVCALRPTDRLDVRVVRPTPRLLDRGAVSRDPLRTALCPRFGARLTRAFPTRADPRDRDRTLEDRTRERDERLGADRTRDARGFERVDRTWLPRVRFGELAEASDTAPAAASTAPTITVNQNPDLPFVLMATLLTVRKRRQV
jgi:hypothetical protein